MTQQEGLRKPGVLFICTGNTARYRMSWPFEDAAAKAGTDEEHLAVFRRVQAEIDLRIQDWLGELA